MITKKEYLKRLEQQSDMVTRFIIWLSKKNKQKSIELKGGKRKND